MKKVLLQLDTDEHPSPFDAIVAHDADVDVLLSHGGVNSDETRALVQDAFFTRGVEDLKNTAVWVGGKDVAEGEQVFAQVQKAYFGPFRVSVMLDSNGCNTTAATTIARIAKERSLDGERAVVIGLGAVGLRSATLLQGEGCEVVVSTLSPDLLESHRKPRGLDVAKELGLGAVGLRSATLLQQEGCEVTVASLPSDLFGDDRAYHRPRGLSVAEKLGLDIREPNNRSELEAMLDGAQIVLAAGPAGVEVLRRAAWAAAESVELLADYNAAEPLGIEGTKATDDLAEYDGKLVLGALAIGGPKMKVHKACVRRLFESNDQVLDTDAVYAIARELV